MKLPELSEEEFGELNTGKNCLKGWRFVEGTERIDPKMEVNMVTRIYLHDDRFFSVTVAHNTAARVGRYPSGISEVFRRFVLKMEFSTEPPGHPPVTRDSLSNYIHRARLPGFNPDGALADEADGIDFEILSKFQAVVEG